MEDNVSAARLSAPKALLVTLGILVAVAALIGLYVLLDVKPLFAGFLFALYWMGVKHCDLKEFLPSVVGALGGLALAAGLHYLPLHYGNPGLFAALAVVVLAIFMQVRNSLPQLVNLSFMLYLTVGTIPAVAALNDYPGMAYALLVAAAFCGGLIWLMGRVSGASKAQPATAQPDSKVG